MAATRFRPRGGTANVPRRLLAISALIAACTAPTPVRAQLPAGGPGVEAQVSGVYRLALGDFRITALSDGTVPQDLHALLTNTTRPKVDSLLRRGYLQNPVEASINAFLIQTGPRLLLVDTGSGELFGSGNGGKLVTSLAAAGVRPEQIDDILVTHVHTDHSGGLVRGGRRLFPNATVHVGKPDVDFFLDARNAAKTGYDRKYFDEAKKTLQPYVDAGKVVTFSGPTQIVPGITAALHPGHTPGSAFYVAESRGETITFVGDVIHVAAVQFPVPNVTIVYDVDPGAAARTRAAQFAVLAARRSLVAAPHLPFPGIGHIRAESSGYSWVPVDYVDRAAR